MGPRVLLCTNLTPKHEVGGEAHLFFRICPTAVIRVWSSTALLSVINLLLTGSWPWVVDAASLPFCRGYSYPLHLLEKIHCRTCLICVLKWLSEGTCPFFRFNCRNLLLWDFADLLLAQVTHPSGLVGPLFCQPLFFLIKKIFFHLFLLVGG